MSAWLPIATGVGGLLVGSGAAIASFFAAAITRRNQRDVMAQQDSESIRALILAAQDRLASADPAVRAQGLAIMGAVVQMSGVRPNDALLIQAVMASLNDEAIREGRRLASTSGDADVYELDDDLKREEQ